jgi:hypothetical protein
MVTIPTLKTRTALTRITNALRAFAKARGWQPGQYQILFRVLEEWGRISFVLIAEDFGGLSNREMWDLVFDHLEASLNQGSDIGFSLGFSVREKKQVEQGGMYTIPEEYVPVEQLLPGTSLTD